MSSIVVIILLLLFYQLNLAFGSEISLMSQSLVINTYEVSHFFVD